MPIAALLPSIIAGGASLIGQGLNALSTSNTNQAQLSYNKEMYDRQRADALADWTMQNEYNSPKAQMQRFKDAGLNPNLIYGQMTNSPVVRTSSAPSYSPEVPKVDLASGVSAGLSAYFDTQLKKAQISNLEAQNSVIVQEALLKQAQILNLGKTTEKTAFDLGMAQELKQTSMDAMRASLRKVEADTASTLNTIEISKAMRAPNLAKAVQEVANLKIQNAKTKEEINSIRANIQNMLNSGKLQELDINLKKNGIQPGDPAYLRMIQQIFSKKIEDVKNYFKK